MERRGSRREAKRASFDDATLIKAFVWQVGASDDEVLVTPNHDAGNDEPARLDVQRVRAKCKWCPRQGSNLRPSAPEADALSN